MSWPRSVLRLDGHPGPSQRRCGVCQVSALRPLQAGFGAQQVTVTDMQPSSRLHPPGPTPTRRQLWALVFDSWWAS
jgi:hypothetical protein